MRDIFTDDLDLVDNRLSRLQKVEGHKLDSRIHPRRWKWSPRRDDDFGPFDE